MRSPWGSHNWSPHLIRMVSWKYTYKILATFYLSKISTLSGNRTLRQLSWFTYWSFNWIVLTFPRLILRYSILNIEITLCSPCPWMLRKGGDLHLSSPFPPLPLASTPLSTCKWDPLRGVSYMLSAFVQFKNPRKEIFN